MKVVPSAGTGVADSGDEGEAILAAPFRRLQQNGTESAYRGVKPSFHGRQHAPLFGACLACQARNQQRPTLT
jgi:hypothetical protein